MSNPNRRYFKITFCIWLTFCAIVLIVYSFQNETIFPAAPIFFTACVFIIMMIIINGAEDKLEITVKGFHPNERRITFGVNKFGSAHLELIHDEGIQPRSGDKLTVQYIKNLDAWKIIQLSRRSFP